MTTLGAGTYNTILGENRNAINDALLASQKHLDDYHDEQKTQKIIEQGENQKVGAMDAGAATGGVSNLARFAVRKAQSGKSFAQMAMDDFNELRGKTPSAPAESFNTIATSEGSVDKATGKLSKGAEGGVEVAETATENQTTQGGFDSRGIKYSAEEIDELGAAPSVDTARSVQNVGGGRRVVIDSAGEGEGGAARGFTAEAPAAPGLEAADTGISDTVKAASEAAGKIGGVAAGDAAVSMAKTIAAKSAFWGGKALGNVGGAIDLVKDINSAAKGGDFFGGEGTSKLDEVGNGLTLAGSALDIAGIALPFLEPLGLALTAAGAVSSTAGSLGDEQDEEDKDKENFQSNQPPAAVPQGAAGLGFVASAPTNPVKMITGSSSF